MSILILALTMGYSVQGMTSEASPFSYETERLARAKPWTRKAFQNKPGEFQFVIIGDRTGGANALKTFQLAMPQINLLQPEFVINVGDLIEGYSDQADELNAEWNEADSSLKSLDMPFFRTPGNHDIANETAREVWLARYGATYYYFVYKNVLFMVLDTEYNRPAPPADMKEKIELYNRLQIEDPAAAQAMLAQFMSDESVVAGLSTPVEFSNEQLTWFSQTLTDHPDVRWTFLFMHEPCWEKPSDSFKQIQAALDGRKHTIFAGHLHYYDYDNIDGNEYITMGPAGASFHHEGPGNVDHIMWVTMAEGGPEMGNIALKGIFDRKGLDPSLFGAYDRKGFEEETPKNKTDE
jgi:3',5'-cyclic AMP phosphodiesterase CpdA